MSRPTAAPREAFRQFTPLTTRWMDNDAYGHLNNVVYYSLFDTAVNAYLIGAGALDVKHGDTIGLVVHTQCHYFEPLAFPQPVEAGLAVTSVGRSSVHYRVGLFAVGAPLAAAQGEFVHVYVDRQLRRPTALPATLHLAVTALQLDAKDLP